MAKYPEKIRSIRALSKKRIPKLLKKNPLTVNEIIQSIYADNVELCDDEIKCFCGKNKSSRPEWKHQIKWGILDLKYGGKIKFNENTEKYVLKKKL